MIVKHFCIALLALFGGAAATTAGAQGFAALVSPPRFELSAKPGEKLRGIFELSNRATTPAQYRIYTADWTFARDYTVDFKTELQPGSCRPWVALERPEVTVPGGGRVRYRFDVVVPTDAAPGECRFGIMVEGLEPAMARTESLAMPISGRLGIIVYVNIGNGKPQLTVVGTKVVDVNGRRLPAIVLRNDGPAHGRLFGFLSGSDAKGIDLEFTPSDLPILPGETREILLTPSSSGSESPIVAYPVIVKGRLEWEGARIEFDQRFE
jgi:hypothetical protein